MAIITCCGRPGGSNSDSWHLGGCVSARHTCDIQALSFLVLLSYGRPIQVLEGVLLIRALSPLRSQGLLAPGCLQSPMSQFVAAPSSSRPGAPTTGQEAAISMTLAGVELVSPQAEARAWSSYVCVPLGPMSSTTMPNNMPEMKRRCHCRGSRCPVIHWGGCHRARGIGRRLQVASIPTSLSACGISAAHFGMGSGEKTFRGSGQGEMQAPFMPVDEECGHV